MKVKRTVALLCSAALLTGFYPQTPAAANSGGNVIVSINLDGEKTAISPYIYGVNGVDLNTVTTTAVRQGGNRLTAYNWENNYSNAGSDWYHSSDTYLSSSSTPGQISLDLAANASAHNIPYTLATLQMAGYVAADKNGNVLENEVAPSSRWNRVEFKKDSAFSLSPDLTDGVVYMDEYVNYLVTNLGNAASGGIRGYSLDNEPALWSGTHARIISSPLSCDELIRRSVELASAVKDVDPTAEIFGPALYGFSAYVSFQSAPDWTTARQSQYNNWFIGFYLDEMKKAELQYGQRLLDVLDIHYYSSDEGSCGNSVCNCSDSSHTECVKARLQSARTLWDSTYVENSWIGQWFSSYLPILPKVNGLINQYYPDTKLAVSEYNFGGGNQISGAIAECDALGVFGKNNVYLATLWPLSGSSEYAISGINLYTNYDGAGSKFGDTSVAAQSSDNAATTAYASINGTDESELHCVLSNKDLTSSKTITINISGNDADYTSAKCYVIKNGSSAITELSLDDGALSGTALTLTLPALSVAHVVLNADDTLYGDVNGDGNVNSVDTTIILRYSVGTYSLDSKQLAAADVNCDGRVNSIDATIISRYAVGTITKLPITS